jgi:hypothetical protein
MHANALREDQLPSLPKYGSKVRSIQYAFPSDMPETALD